MQTLRGFMEIKLRNYGDAYGSILSIMDSISEMLFRTSIKFQVKSKKK